MPPSGFWKRPTLRGIVAGATLVYALGASGQTSGERNFDARPPISTKIDAPVASAKQGALETFRREVPEVAATYDARTGVTRTLSSRNGTLTGPIVGAPLEAAETFVKRRATLLGLTLADLEGFEVRSARTSPATGATRVFLRQTAHGLPLYNGELQVNLDRDGRIVSINNGFVESLEGAVNTTTPTLTAAQAIASGAAQIGSSVDPDAAATAQLMLLPIQRGDVRLVWNFQFEPPGRVHYYDFTVDATTGEVWTRFDWVAFEGEFTVYPKPVESPNFATPAPPADARTVVTHLPDPTASPSGWFNTGTTAYTIMRGNNVHAYDDRDTDGFPPLTEPDCGATLQCNFPLDLTLHPSNSVSAAVANLFYWTNLVHDIQYQYGFDEAAGNFQVNNFGRGGVGGDEVLAEAQDGAGVCNASFTTPVDGERPRMQTYICGDASPARDSALDNGIIVHEYAHGISNRTVGGPLNVSCLNNTQQMGEGWSDWLALVYTARASDTATQARTLGTWQEGQGPTGSGLRPAAYSTDTAVNGYQYADIATQAVPHGVGFVWAEMLWVAYWALVDAHGFNADLSDAGGGSGNQRMMLYVQEGMANTACSPTFIDARDGIIAAATTNYSGEDVCRLWTAFASRGLGTNATTSGSHTLSATNGFDVPASCACSPLAVADAGVDRVVCPGATATVGTAEQPGNTYSWAPGGETTAEIDVSPLIDTAYTVTATTATCGSATDSATVFVATDDVIGLSEGFDSGSSGWTATGLWHIADASLCGSAPPASAPSAMYYGQDATCTYDTGSATSGTLTSPIVLGIDSGSVLRFNYYRHVENSSAGSYDITQVNIIDESDGSKTVAFFRDGLTWSESAWVSSGDLSLAAFEGKAIRVEFEFNSVDEFTNDRTGWFVDDVTVTSSFVCETCLSDVDGDGVCDDVDNCLDEYNADQADVDSDGFGNLCDADANGDGIVGGPDFTAFSLAWGARCGETNYNPLVDFTSDCVVGGPDFSVLVSRWALAPGPSGLACAGTPPCP